MKISDLREHLAAHHAEHPQRKGLAMLHLDSIEYALHALGALGHRLEISHSEAEPVLAFPQMLYKDLQEPITVDSSAERDAKLNDGWRETPLKVQPKTLAEVLPKPPVATIVTKKPE